MSSFHRGNPGLAASSMTVSMSRTDQASEPTSFGAGHGPALLDGTFPVLPRVLVVDDEPSNLVAACKLLECWGITPTLATDGAEAVALACGRDFDLILMDLQMSGMNGLEATQQIRINESQHSGVRAPVLAYTSGVLKEALLRDCGMDGVLEKPCSASELRECLLHWCTPRGGAKRETGAQAAARAWKLKLDRAP